MTSLSKSMIIWDNTFSVGVKEMDEQHQKLFGTINRLGSSMNAPANTEKVSDIIKELLDYSVYHFLAEETYFEKFNYENKEVHTKLHNYYKEKVNHFIDDFQENKYLSFEIIDFLITWWNGHVIGEDKLYTECFHDHGIY